MARIKAVMSERAYASGSNRKLKAMKKFINAL